jgi:hypothetical protein
MKKTSIIEICVKELEEQGYDKEYAEKLCTVEYAKLD